MDSEGLLDLISQVVSEETDAPFAKLAPETTAKDVPGWDSLAHVRIIYSLEARLAVPIDIMRSYDAENVGELADFLMAEVAAAGSSTGAG